MTHFSDGVRVGEANTPSQSRIISTVSTPGVPTTAINAVTLVPLAISAGNIVASAIIDGAATLAAGTGVTSSTTAIPGKTVLVLDCPRCIAITGTAGGVTAVSFTIVGYDVYKQPITYTYTGPAATATTITAKAFMYIESITSAATTTAAVTIQTSDTMGLYYRTDAWDYINITYNAAKITASTGFTAAVTTDPQIVTTGDPRGTYALQSASDGSKRFTVLYVITDPNTQNSVYGIRPYTT